MPRTKNSQEVQDAAETNEAIENSQEVQDVKQLPHINDLYSMRFRTDDPNVIVGIRPDIKPGKYLIYPIAK